MASWPHTHDDDATNGRRTHGRNGSRREAHVRCTDARCRVAQRRPSWMPLMPSFLTPRSSMGGVGSSISYAPQSSCSWLPSPQSCERGCVILCSHSTLMPQQTHLALQDARVAPVRGAAHVPAPHGATGADARAAQPAEHIHADAVAMQKHKRTVSLAALLAAARSKPHLRSRSISGFSMSVPVERCHACTASRRCLLRRPTTNSCSRIASSWRARRAAAAALAASCAAASAAPGGCGRTEALCSLRCLCSSRAAAARRASPPDLTARSSPYTRDVHHHWKR